MSTEGDYFDDITNQIAAVYDINDICIIGDTNCRIANTQEVYFAENDAEEGALPEFMFNKAFSVGDLKSNFSFERVNADTKVYEFGLTLIQLCHSMDLAVMNGRAFSDKAGDLKCFADLRGERCVDLLICNKNKMEHLSDFKISDFLEFSDHRYVSFKLRTYTTSRDESEKYKKAEFYPKWKENKKQNFVDFVNNSDVDPSDYITYI